MLALTTAFLIIVFVGAEFYRFRRRLTGWIREIRPVDGDPTGLMGVRLRVVTSKSDEITAFVSGCQMCASPIEIGEIVSLVPGPNGYFVKSPWISRRKHGGCLRGVAS
jgi:hypothetical protein